MRAGSRSACPTSSSVFVLVTLVAGSALVPLTAPVFAATFIGSGLTLSPLELGLKLAAMLGGSMIAAVIIRRIVGTAILARYKAEIDGANILVMFVFVAAVMEHVAARLIDAPRLVLGLVALASATFFVVFVTTALVFRSSGRERALALGLAAAQRNLGLMAAATGGVVPDVTWLYFAACQLPIFLTPPLLRTTAGASSPSAARCRSGG
jgi:BASS family bile acid:Na+ symporter